MTSSWNWQNYSNPYLCHVNVDVCSTENISLDWGF